MYAWLKLQTNGCYSCHVVAMNHFIDHDVIRNGRLLWLALHYLTNRLYPMNLFNFFITWIWERHHLTGHVLVANAAVLVCYDLFVLKWVCYEKMSALQSERCICIKDIFVLHVLTYISRLWCSHQVDDLCADDYPIGLLISLVAADTYHLSRLSHRQNGVQSLWRHIVTIEAQMIMKLRCQSGRIFLKHLNSSL